MRRRGGVVRVYVKILDYEGRSLYCSTVMFCVQVATAIETYAKGKPVVEVTKTARRKCKCPHNDCVCGVSISIQKADCPCECAGQCH